MVISREWGEKKWGVNLCFARCKSPGGLLHKNVNICNTTDLHV